MEQSTTPASLAPTSHNEGEDYVALVVVVRSAKDAGCLVHVPVRAGFGDSLHPAQHESVQLVGRTSSCKGVVDFRTGDTAQARLRARRQDREAGESRRQT